MSKAIYPGSFDPVTFGHLDIIKRSSLVFDDLTIGILNNSSKTPLFSLEERVNMLKVATKDIPNVHIECFGGLLVEYCREHNLKVIVRGLRAFNDFDYELQMSQSNRKITTEVDTVFLTTSIEYSFLSSSTVKEYARYGVNVEKFVPPVVIPLLKEKMNQLYHI